MSQSVRLKKFKTEEVEEYMKGKWFSKWEGIKPEKEARRRIKVVADSRDKRDFVAFSGFHFETIKGVENYYSIRIGGKWRCFFVWKDNEAWEIDISDHDYKKVGR